MPTPNALTLAREHTIFVAAETTRGTLVFPAATDLVVPAGYGKLGQVPTYTDSDEIVDSRSLIEQFRDALPAGDWSLPMYFRPSGTAGAVPQGAALFKALFGKQTITGGTSVAYDLEKVLASVSIWLKYGTTVFFAAGATVNQCKLSVTKKGAFKFDFSGGFMTMGWVGTDELAEAIDGDPVPVAEIEVLDAKKYTSGGRIKIGTDDNGGAGYAVTAVDVATNLLTISPGCDTDQSAGAVVAPFLPAGTIIGSPVESRTLQVSLDGGSTTAKVKSLDLTIDNGIQYQEDEISDEENPTDYTEGGRKVSGSMTQLMRRDDLGRFYDAINAGQEVEMEITGGSGAGNLFAISMGKTRIKAPSLNPSAPTVELASEITALGTVGEDEISMLLT